MADRILTAEVARVLQAESVRNGEMLAWIVTGGDGEWTARPVACGMGALPYVLTAETLDGLRASLPDGVVRSARMPADPAGVVEIWVSKGA